MLAPAQIVAGVAVGVAVKATPAVTVTELVAVQPPLPVTVTVYMVVPDMPFAIGLAILVAAKVLPAGLSDQA